MARMARSLAHLESLQATRDTTKALLRNSKALLESSKRASAAIGAIADGKQVEDEDEARVLLAAQVVEILSAAGMVCELRHLGVTSH